MTRGSKERTVGLPADWKIKSVRDIGQIRTGPFGTLLKASEYSEFNGVPVISVGEIGPGYLKISDATPRVSEKVVRRLPQYVLRAGDIVFGRKGAVDRSALVSKSQEGWFLGSDGISIRPAEPSYPPYVAFQFQQTQVQNWLLQNATGTTMASLNQKVLSEVAIPYAPVLEQRAIADTILDVDAALSSLNELIAKKRDLKQAAMQQLLSGRRRLPGFEASWEKRFLGECLLSTPDYGINAPAVPYSDRLPTYVRITDISDEGNFEPAPRVSVDTTEVDKYVLSAGDVVFARTGASVGKSYRYRPEDGPLVFAGFLIRVRPNPDVLLPSFLAAQASSERYWNWVRTESARSGQPGINGRQYSRLPVLVPPMEEQAAIAAIFSDMDGEIGYLAALRTKTLALKQATMQQLLTGRIRLT